MIKVAVLCNAVSSSCLLYVVLGLRVNCKGDGVGIKLERDSYRRNSLLVGGEGYWLTALPILVEWTTLASMVTLK